MKIGILTFHDGPNHGAYFQAYATLKTLQKLGHEVQIINYKNPVHQKMEGWHGMLKYRRPIRFLHHMKKHRAFNRAHKQFPLTPYTTNVRGVKKTHFDVVVIGSDVVWNYKIFGFDPVFFGDVNADKVISYAASFGWVREDDLHPPEMAAYLKRFAHISVRDSNSYNIVKSVSGIAPAVVQDPTLIYDFSPDEVVTERILKLGKYILVYAYVREEGVVSKIRDYARKHAMKTVALGYYQPWCDRILMDVGPLEWLGFFKHAQKVVTSTFHGTIFSLKYEKPFLYVHNEKAYNRVRSLMEDCGLGACFSISDVGMVEIEPDYKNVSKYLDPKISASRTWLENSLGQ